VAGQVADTLKTPITAYAPVVLTLVCLFFVRRAVDEIDRGTAPSSGIRTVDTLRSLTLGAIAVAFLWSITMSRWESDRLQREKQAQPGAGGPASEGGTGGG
jgi:hypothetical protein